MVFGFWLKAKAEFLLQYLEIYSSLYTVEPVNNDHPRDPKKVAVVDRWSFFRDSFML